MKLEKGIPDELFKRGYWLRVSTYHTFVVCLKINEGEDGDVRSVKAVAYLVDDNMMYDDIDLSKLNNGDEVSVFACINEGDWWVEIDIWAKYYFPKFNTDTKQWYHKDDEIDCDYMADFSEILKQTYKIAMYVSKLETY